MPSSFLIEVTLQLSCSFAPLSKAFSKQWATKVNGLIIPAVGHNKLPMTEEEILGSNFKVSSLSNRIASTPFSLALSFKEAKVAIFSSLNPKVIEPIGEKETSNSLQMEGYILFPNTLNLALFVPGRGSYPEWTMAELAIEETSPTSFLASRQITFNSYLERFLVTNAPLTPAPITITSNILTIV